VSSQHLVKNRILRQLSADELKSVQPWLTPVELRSNVVLHELGDAMERVYFPLSGMISLLAVMQSGEAIETGIVGADGLVGGDAAINGHAFGQMTVQQDGAALTMPRAKFVDAYLAHPHLRNLVDRYQANAACHALHSVRSRLCRWLLQSQDLIGSDTFSLTQEFLSHMLGVRRNTVSVEAHAVQEAGLIRYRRGNITILNRDGLEDCTCECYSVIRAETDKLMGPANTPSEPGA
jgi:CRP-like cAMP-binding protein